MSHAQICRSLLSLRDPIAHLINRDTTDGGIISQSTVLLCRILGNKYSPVSFPASSVPFSDGTGVLLLSALLCCLGLSQGVLYIEEEGTNLPPPIAVHSRRAVSVLTDVISGQSKCLFPVLGWFTSPQEIS